MDKYIYIYDLTYLGTPTEVLTEVNRGDRGRLYLGAYLGRKWATSATSAECVPHGGNYE
jgi:hypothetical protein